MADKIVVPIPFNELPLSDDFMFGEVMRRPKICKLFLEALLGKKIAKIKYITKQQDISDSFTGHGIRLDIYLRDDEKTLYAVEMQTTGGVILFKRIRYYQGTMDRHNLEKGDYYTDLPESFIIMICTKDLFGYGLAVYERQITMKGCGDVKYDDGSHVFILNSDYKTGNADKAILEFLDCIRKNDANSETYSSELMGMVCPAIIEVRNDSSKEAEYMIWQTKLMDVEHAALERGREEGMLEGERRGLLEGERRGALQAYLGLAADGLLSIPDGARKAGVDEKEFSSRLRQAYPQFHFSQ